MKLLNDNQKQALHARRNYGKTIFRYLGAATLSLSSVLFLTSCADSASDRAEKVGGITARQVIENPSAYVGKTVTVSGDVEEIHGPRAFNMDSGISLGELLVVGREPFPQIPEAGNRAYVVSDVATVTGVVRMLVTADIEREIGWDLDPQIEANFNAKPVLVAQSVSFRAGAGRADTIAANANTNQPMMNNNAGQTTANNNSGQMATNNANQTASGNKLTDAGVYASTADKLSLVGKEAQFSNLRVARVVGPRTFTVASGSGEIYVMLDEESARGVGTQGKIGVGKTLNLTGRFERLQAEEINDISNNRFRPLTAAEREFLKNTPVFLQADSVSDLK
ncbi:MAG: hypothetical protein M3367_19530 [Acidobacteriota bacterium]|nr:hypothetical protein [Acidobacteriota bacterium]